MTLKKIGGLLFAAAFFLLSAVPAFADSNRAVFSGYAPNLDTATTTMFAWVNYMHNNDLVTGALLPFDITAISSRQQLDDTVNSAIQDYATENSIDMSDGVTFPFVTDAPVTHYNGVLKTGIQRVLFGSTTTDGAATFYLTDDGLIDGNALCPTGVLNTTVSVNDSGSIYSSSNEVTNSNKTLTVSVAVLAGSTLEAAPDATPISVAVDCY